MLSGMYQTISTMKLLDKSPLHHLHLLFLQCMEAATPSYDYSQFDNNTYNFKAQYMELKKCNKFPHHNLVIIFDFF